MKNFDSFFGTFVGALQAKKRFCVIRRTENVESVLKLFYKEGFLRNYHFTLDGKYIIVFFKFTQGGVNVLKFGLKRVSKPSKKIFFTFEQIKKRYNISDFFLIYNNFYGFLLGKDVFFLRVGGELIFERKNK